MAEKPSDFNLPEKIVSKILKDSLPDNVAVSKDAKSAAARGAAMFILNLVISANSQAEETKRDTINCQDILDALSYVGLEEYAPQLIRFNSQYKREQKRKQTPKKAPTTKQNSQTDTVAEESYKSYQDQAVSISDSQDNTDTNLSCADQPFDEYDVEIDLSR